MSVIEKTEPPLRNRRADARKHLTLDERQWVEWAFGAGMKDDEIARRIGCASRNIAAWRAGGHSGKGKDFRTAQRRACVRGECENTPEPGVRLCTVHLEQSPAPVVIQSSFIRPPTKAQMMAGR